MHENDTAGQLTDREAAVVVARAAGRTTAQIASDLGLAPSTVYRVLQRPYVRAALDEALAERWTPDAERLRSEVTGSIDRLVAIRDAATSHPSTQVRAAVALIELATQLHELVNVLPRLAALETLLAGHGEGVRDAD